MGGSEGSGEAGDVGGPAELDGGGCGVSGVHAASSRPAASRAAATPALRGERDDPATIPHIKSLSPAGGTRQRRTTRRLLAQG